MSDHSSIIEIQEDWKVSQEPLGTKAKFWFKMTDSEGHEAKWLFKRARPETGEHWAEKISSEIAGELLKLPTHQVRLANYAGNPGCAVKSFLEGRERMDLIHGNEILGATIKGYSMEKVHRHADHCLPNIFLGLEKLAAMVRGLIMDQFKGQVRATNELPEVPIEVDPQPDLGSTLVENLTGYLVFDALVGNTDRHHENWGCLFDLPQLIPNEPDFRLTFLITLAPTFDHGSSLGRELRPDRRMLLLNDSLAFAAYLRRGRSGIFAAPDQKRALTPVEVVEWIAERYPDYWKPWKEKLEELEAAKMAAIIERVPAEWIEQSSKDVAFKLLTANLAKLLKIP